MSISSRWKQRKLDKLERQARAREWDELNKKLARAAWEEQMLKSPCGRAKIGAGMDPLGHCPYPVAYSREGPCRLGKVCGFTKPRVPYGWEPAEELR